MARADGASDEPADPHAKDHQPDCHTEHPGQTARHSNDQPLSDALHDEGADRRQFVVRRDVHKRLDVYLHGRLKGISRSRVQKLIELGGVKVNGRRRKASTAIRCGDRLDVILPPPAIRVIEPEPIPLDVLYEDPWFIVINKQAGLIVHPARSQLRGTLINGLAHHFKLQQESAGRPWHDWQTRGFRPGKKAQAQVDGLSDVGAADLRPGIIHRLDRNTTGVIVVAKNDEAHWQIARQFEDRLTLKAYLAVVHGGPDDAGGVIDQPIGPHPTLREPYAVRHDSKGKPSVTIYRVRRRYLGFTLLELELKTGRTHQIRVHLSYLGMPVVGDIFYGGEPIGHGDLDDPPIAAGARRYLNFARDHDEGQRVKAKADERDDVIIAHPALHAALLGFEHPMTGKQVTFTAPVHEPMATLLGELSGRTMEGPVVEKGYYVDLAEALSPPGHGTSSTSSS